MRRITLIIFFMLIIIAHYIVVADSQPQKKLIVTVSGDPEVTSSHLTLVIKQGDKYSGLSCQLSAGRCEFNVSRGTFYVVAAVFPAPLAAVRVRGDVEKIWTGDRDTEIRYRYQDGRLESHFSVQPASEGEALSLHIEARRACVVKLKKGDIDSAHFRIEGWSRWRMGIWEDKEAYYLVIPRGGVAWLRVDVEFQGRLLDIARELSSYGIIDFYREVLTCPVQCKYGNTSLAYVVFNSLYTSIKSYVEDERESLARLGFKADSYLQDIDYSLGILQQATLMLKEGDVEEGGALAEKGLISCYLALHALKSAESDSVISFLFLLILTFFVSTIASNLVETERRGLAAIAIFAILLAAELILLPHARMAIYVLTPEYIGRSSSSALGFSLFTSFVTLGVIISLAFFAKGTFLSDMFWYTVRNMRKRKLRAILTVVSIAVVASASAFFLSLGSATIIKEEGLQSDFQGLSMSSHITTITYIYRGVDIGTEVIVKETYQPVSPGIVKWLSNMPWVRERYVVAADLVYIKKNHGPPLKAYLVATNATKVDGAWVSKNLAEKLQVGEGDSININGKEFKVARVLDKPPLLIDGTPLIEFEGSDYLILPSLENAGMPIYKIILEGKPPESTVDALLKIGFDKIVKHSSFGGQQGTAQITINTYLSYRVCAGDGEQTTCKYIFGEVQRFSGTPEFIVVMAISSLTITTVLLGSIYEKRREYSIMTSLGASPGHIALLLLIEGFTYGVIGGAAGYLLANILQTAFRESTAAVTSQTVGQVVLCFTVAIVPSIIGSLLPARKAILYVVPSRSLMVKGEEIRVKEDHVEAELPLRLAGDEELFAEYIKSLAGKRPPIEWGPLYMRAEEYRQNGELERLELLVSFKGKRSALYRVKIYPPKSRKANLRIEAYAAKGSWGVEHKTTAKELILSIRGDLLNYVEWKKKKTTQDD